MKQSEGAYISSVSTVFDLESKLANTLGDAADELEHMEFFDAEQRAEIYTILDAMKSDTAAHRTVMARLAQQTSGGTAGA